MVIMVVVIVVNMLSARVERATVIERLRQESIEAAQPVTFALSEQMSLQAGRLGLSSDLEATNDHAWMDRAVLDVVRGQRILRFDVFLPDGSLLYSTDHSAPVGNMHDLETDRALETAIKDKFSSRYANGVMLTLISGEKGTFDIVETFLPIYAEGSAEGEGVVPHAVFGFYRDVTASVSAATASAARFRLATVIVTMGLMYLALLFIVSRAQKQTNAIRQRLAETVMMERELAEQLDQQNARLIGTNDKLKEANEARSRFLSTASHELKTPLTALLAFTDILRKNKDGNLTPRQAQQLDIMRRSGGHLKLLIDDLLDMSRIDARTLKLEPTRFSMSRVLQEMAEGMAPIFSEKKQQFDVVLPPADAYVAADRARIVQVVSNLLSNASKYSPESASVVMTGEVKEGAVHVHVKDSGIGISEADQKHLFQLFFRAENAETRKVPGSGLGLVIVKSIVELHGGKVGLQSTWGEGSTFSFSLPLAGEDAVKQLQDAQSPAEPPASQQQAA